MSLHYSYNMVGEVRSTYDVPLWKRYLHRSKHHRPSRFFMSFVSLLDVIAYG